MDKHEAALILQNSVLENLVLTWSDCKRLESGIRQGLEEIARRRQEAGPEAVEMMGGVIRDVVLCPGNPG